MLSLTIPSNPPLHISTPTVSLPHKHPSFCPAPPRVMSNFATLLALALLTVVCVRAMEIEDDYESPYPEVAANCSNIRIPPMMCPKCHLRPENPDGTFGTGVKKDIFDFDTPACIKQVENYVRINPCDTVRAQFLKDYKTSKLAYAKMAQFMYTICEQCCDMIPIGSLPEEYEARLKSNTLHTDTRGNGVAHFYFDICKLFPKVTRFIKPWWKTIDDMPKLCPLAVYWMKSKYARGWPGIADGKGIPKDLQKAIGTLPKTFGCRKKRVWKDCIPQEQRNGRV